MKYLVCLLLLSSFFISCGSSNIQPLSSQDNPYQKRLNKQCEIVSDLERCINQSYDEPSVTECLKESDFIMEKLYDEYPGLGELYIMFLQKYLNTNASGMELESEGEKALRDCKSFYCIQGFLKNLLIELKNFLGC